MGMKNSTKGADGYRRMLNLRTGPNFHPFHSVNNHFQHNVHKFQDGRQSAILDCILVLVTHHIYTMLTLPLPLRAQLFIDFALRPTVFEIWRKTENPRWPPAAILDSILVLVRHHGYTIPILPLPLGAQIFIGFALRSTVSKIQWKMENPRWPPAAILDNILVLVTHHIYTIPTLPLPLWAQIFIGFTLQDHPFPRYGAKSEKLAYFGPLGLNLRPLERFNRIHLYSQFKLP